MSRISIVDLEVFYCIGVPEEERAKPQRLLVSLDMDYDFSTAATKDNPEPRWHGAGGPDPAFYQRLEEWQRKFKDEGDKGKAEIIIGKNRHGSTETVVLYFNERLTKFGNLVAEDHLPDAPPDDRPF